MISKDQLCSLMESLRMHKGCFSVDQMYPYLIDAMSQAGIDTPLRMAAFLANIAVESSELTVWEENLNYSWQRLRQVFPKYFPTDEAAQPFHHQPEKIANRVYGSRMGNGDETSGDGWRYRGRSPIQLTGRANYLRCGQNFEIDLIEAPDLAATVEVGFKCAVWFWLMNGLNNLADAEEFKEICIKINGGLNGYSEREKYYLKGLAIINAV